MLKTLASSRPAANHLVSAQVSFCISHSQHLLLRQTPLLKMNDNYNSDDSQYLNATDIFTDITVHYHTATNNPIYR